MGERYILLAEDNPYDEELTIRAFRDSRLINEIVVARDGAEALEVLLGNRARLEPPQLILLDLKLPKLDGLEVLERLRADTRTKLLPVVILTSSTEEDDIIRSYSLGANSYVRKPVGFEAFQRAVKDLGLYWLLINEPPPSRLDPSRAASC
jgi:two-component system response regulator